jgi:hypothetical protein
VLIAPTLKAAMSKHDVLRDAKCPTRDGVARQISVARAMDLEKSLLKQITSAAFVTHFRANESMHARSERTIQSFESRKASSLVLAHQYLERFSTLRLSHGHGEKIFCGR